MNKVNRKRFGILVLLGIISFLPLQANAKGGSPMMELIHDNIFLVLSGLVLLAVAITLISLVFNFIELQKIRLQKELGIEKEEVIQTEDIPTMQKINSWMWNLVPKDKEKTIDLGHNYDGIRELDNKLPPWWVALFYGTIIFAAVYMYYYQWGGSDWSSIQEYEVAMQDAETQKEKFLAKVGDVIDENTVVFIDNADRIAQGAEIYIKNCAACHGMKGEGLVGPNFTDDYWIHGGSVKSIFKTIKYGVPEKGMIAWASQLKPKSIQNVSSYIHTLKGTDPPNQKAQEGELYVEEEITTPSVSNDEVKTEVDNKN